MLHGDPENYITVRKGVVVGLEMRLVTSHVQYLTAPEDYTDINVNFSVPINQTDDLCTSVNIEMDNVLEDPELFLADLESDTVELCDARQAFVVILDSTRK